MQTKTSARGCAIPWRDMTEISAVPIDIGPAHKTSPNTSDDAFDPLPDETVLKTGWLMKKGRRGVALNVQWR